MLAEWRRAQREVWELDADAQHLRASGRSTLDRLLQLRLRYAEVGLAARRFRRGAGTGAAAAAAAPATPRQRGGSIGGASQLEACDAVELEVLLGRDAAQVWAAVFQAMARRPGALPLLAGMVGYAGHEFLARLASVLVGDPVRAALSGGLPAARVLDEILAAEFARMPSAEGCEAPQASTLLADGAFLTALVQELTAHEPACMVWARSVLSPDVLEAVSRLLRSSPSRHRSAPRTPSAHPRTQSLDQFLADVPPPPQVDEGSPLCSAASAIVTALCARAPAAPLGLCRLAAALCRQLRRRPPGAEKAEQAEVLAKRAQHALLGSLLLCRWLVPALLVPGAGFVLHADSGSRAALTTLAKLLKAVALDSVAAGGGARGWGSEDGAAFGGASAGFVCQEAQRLSRGLFDALVARGTCGGEADEGAEAAAWPQCVACTSADLALLSQALAGEAAASTAAAALDLPSSAVTALTRIRPDASPPVEVVCWLQRHFDLMPDFTLDQGRVKFVAEAHGLARQGAVAVALDENASQQARQRAAPQAPLPEASPLASGSRTAGSAPARSERSAAGLSEPSQSPLSAAEGAGGVGNRTRTSTASSEPGSLFEEPVDELVILPLVDPMEDAQSQGTPVGKSPASADDNRLLPDARADGCGESAEAEQRAGLSLLWQLLADPRPLDGREDAPLVQALAAGHLHDGGASLPRQIRLEMLTELLRRPGAFGSAAGAGSPGGYSCAAAAEAELLEILHRCLASQRRAATEGRRALARLQVAEKLVSQQCAEACQALKHHARMVAELWCNACLQALWAAPAHGDGGRGGATPSDSGRSTGVPPPLELCVVASMRRVEASGVKVYERSRCPCHCVAAVTATMGFDSRLDDGFKHWSARSLGQAVRALQRLPLETAVQGFDTSGIASALHTVLDLTVSHVIANFRLAPIVTATEACTVYGAGSSGPGVDPASGALEEWAPPSTLTRVDSNHLRECVARFLFTHLHARLFPQEPTDADSRVEQRVRRLRWLRPEHLDVPSAILEAPQVDRAARALQRLHRLRSPVQMLAELAHAFRSVTEAACIRAQVWASGSGRDSDAFGADSSLPLFILVVLRANPLMFSSVLAYAECFIAPAQRLTEQGYALTQAHAAVTFTESVRPEDLNGLEPGEWERHMGVECASGAA